MDFSLVRPGQFPERLCKPEARAGHSSASGPEMARGPREGGEPAGPALHPLSRLDRGTPSIVLTRGEQGSPTLDSLSPGRELQVMLKAWWDLGVSVGVLPSPGLPGQLRGMP